MRFFIASSILLLTAHLVVSQEGSQQAEVPDSVRQQQVAEVTELLRRADSLRVSDSIAKVDLLVQLNNLKTSDNLKKLDLLRQLKEKEEADSIRWADRVRRIDSLKSLTPGFPVAPFNDTIFNIYTRLGPFSARDRAANISSKIKLLTASETQEELQFDIQENEQSTDVIWNDIILFSITDEDAMWVGSTRTALAGEYAERIRHCVEKFYSDNSLEKILKRVGLVAMVVAILFLLIIYVNRIFSYFKKLIFNQKGKTIRGIKVRDYEFLTAQRIVHLIFSLLNFLKVVVVLLALYLSLPVLFSIFPWTKGLADRLFGYIISPLKQMGEGVLDFIPNLITIVVIYLVVHYLIRGIRFLAREVERGELVIHGFYQDWARPTYNIIRFLLYAFMFVMIFPYLPGSESGVFKGVIIFVGVLISLGSISAMGNMIAGLVITYMRPFKEGDQVKIGEVTGEVMEKSLLVTRIRTIKNEEITVPNSAILSGHTINYSSASDHHGLILYTSVTIGYDVPWDKIHQLLIAAANATEGVSKEKEPFVLQTSLDEFYVRYEINLYTRQAAKMAVILSELHKNILEQFAEAGVEIMSPHYQATRDGSRSTIAIPRSKH